MKERKSRKQANQKLKQVNIAARGEPALWTMGGTLILGVMMIVAFLILIKGVEKIPAIVRYSLL